MNQDFWDSLLTKYSNMSDEEFENIVDRIESSHPKEEENMDEVESLIKTDTICCLLPRRNKIHVFGNQRPESVEKTFQFFSDIREWLDHQKVGDCFILLDEHWMRSPYPYHSIIQTEYQRLDNGFWCINNAPDDIKDHEYDVFNILTEIMLGIIRNHEMTIHQNDRIYEFHERVKDLAKYCLWSGIWHHYQALDVKE